MNARAVRIACLLLVLLLGWLQIKWWFGTGGRRDVNELQAKIEAQTRDNEARRQRNDALSAEVKDLTDPGSGGAAVEERARDELGMIKPGETFYRVINTRPGDASTTPQDAPATQAVDEADAEPGQ